VRPVRSRYVTALEHERLPIGQGPPGASLTDEEAERLLVSNEQHPGFCERGYRSVTLSQYCGVVALGERVLEILPKVDERLPPEECRGILLRLLRHAGDIPLPLRAPAGQHLAHAQLLEMFIASFFEAVIGIVKGGLLHRYREAEEDLPVVRGAIVASRQFALHSNRPDRIACRYDDLTVDNTWNRLLKLGLHVVRPWMRNAALYRQWTELWAIFGEVDHTLADPRALGRLVYDRHAVRYRAAIEWVGWIVRLLSPSLRAGESEVPALLFDTNALFESVVGVLLRRDPGHGVEIDVKETHQHLARFVESGPKAYRLLPDLVVRRGEKVVAIGDAKWKRLSVGRNGYLYPRESDLYQLHVYAAAFNCPNVALIYPWHRELAGSRETRLDLRQAGGGNVSVSVMCIDLSSDAFAVVRGSDTPELGRLLELSDAVGRRQSI